MDVIQVAIDTLNEALAADPHAIRNLFSTEVGCNESLADHPTIQVDNDGNETTVRMLGLLNGIMENIALAVDGRRRRIAMVFDNRLVKFEEYDQALIAKEIPEFVRRGEKFAIVAASAADATEWAVSHGCSSPKQFRYVSSRSRFEGISGRVVILPGAGLHPHYDEIMAMVRLAANVSAKVEEWPAEKKDQVDG